MAIYPLGNSIPSYPVTSYDQTRSSAQIKQDIEKPSQVEKASESKTEQDKGNQHSRNSELSNEDKQKVQQLAARDREVKAHEAAHKSAGGSLTSAAHFEYETGPDNKRYAVGGEVSIDTSKVQGDPHATLQKANQIRAAALAPAQPSNQDRSVANHAATMANEARVEVVEQRKAEAETEAQEREEAQTEETTQNTSVSTPSTAEKSVDQSTQDASVRSEENIEEIIQQNTPENTTPRVNAYTEATGNGPQVVDYYV